MMNKNSAKDPRCPVCGNAVLGLSVQGNEGPYHPECARAPYRDAAPIVVPVYQIHPKPWVWQDQWVSYDGCSVQGSLALVN